MRLLEYFKGFLDPIRTLINFLAALPKRIEKLLTKKTVNELVTLVVHFLVFLAAQAFVAFLLK